MKTPFPFPTSIRRSTPERWTGAGAILTVLGLVAIFLSRTATGSAVAADPATGQIEKRSNMAPIAGHLVTPEGLPVRGARVTWISREERTTVSRAEVETDADGRFRFSDTGRLRKEGQFPQLMLEARGWGLTVAAIPESDPPAEITLNPATELRVSFLTPEGRPVAGLKVVPVFVFLRGEGLFDSNGKFLSLPQEASARFVRQTDDSGALTIPALPQGYRVRLRVLDERFASLGMNEDILLSGESVTQAAPIRMLPGASIEGRIVFGPTGEPASDVRVGAQGVNPGEGWGEAETDANGFYRMKQLRPGVYNIALDLKGQMAQSWTASAHEKVLMTQGETRSGIDFKLIHGAVIAGKVVDATTGKPIPSIHVGVYGPAHPRSSAWVQSVVTGPDGTYFHRVPEGDQYLYLTTSQPPPGYLMPSTSSRNLTLKNGEKTMFDFSLPRDTR